MVRFGEAIRAEREKRGWSQNHLARLADVNQSTLQKIETNIDREPGLYTSAKLARALKVTVDSLVGAEFTRPGDATLATAQETRPSPDPRETILKVQAELDRIATALEGAGISLDQAPPRGRPRRSKRDPKTA